VNYVDFIVHGARIKNNPSN